MAQSSWQDTIVGDRMQLDQEFGERVQSAGLSRQEWGLVMTAVDFEIENPEDAERAELVANTDKVEHIMPEVERVGKQMSGMGVGGDGGPEASSGGGLLDAVKSSLGLGGGGDGSEQKQADAERLASEYARALQNRLERKGRWESVCTQAASEGN